MIRLGIQSKQFTEEERGGLLVEDDVGSTVLHRLVGSSVGVGNFVADDSNRRDDNNDKEQRHHHELTDERCLSALVRLRNMGYLKKEDVRERSLVPVMCCQSYFAEKRFRFLLDLDPDALTRPCAYGCLPLHYAAFHQSATTTIECFRFVLAAGIRYFPQKRGILLLFTLTAGDYWKGKTPFHLACEKHGPEAVEKVVNEVLEDRGSVSDKRDRRRRPDDHHHHHAPNYVDAFLSAAVDDRVDLNGMYFMFRKSPDALQQSLQLQLQQPKKIGGSAANSSSSTAAVVVEGRDRGSTTTATLPKRRRKRKRRKIN